jgi:Fe-S oxidoreductase
MAKDSRVSYLPTEGLSYDPADEKYWDAGALQGEVTRAFEICHGCRMCFKYCDAFPRLFTLLDEKHDGDVRRLGADETRDVMDACFQCKQCEVQCPYTPRDGHEFQLDFPALVHRYKAQEVRREGVRLRDRVLGDPDTAGRMARLSLGLANVMNRNAVHRWFFEKLMGVHREKQLPEFAANTFESWARREGKLSEEPGGETVLFPTCYVQHNEPQIGRDTLDVLERNGVGCKVVAGLQCCGMPAWEHGDLDTLRARAVHNLARLSPHVEAGAKVLVINPTCSMMMRREYPRLVATGDRTRAQALATAVRDPAEHLWSIRDEPRFDRGFKSAPPGPVSYHAPCHLRAQGIGFKGRDLLRRIPGVQVQSVIECCGHDGTYAMKVEGFEASQRAGGRAFEGMRQGGGTTWATECPLAALQFEQHAGLKPLHPMSILARAYREDGFEGVAAPPVAASADEVGKGP